MVADYDEFMKTCKAIETGVKGIKKEKLLYTDIDGSAIQIYYVNGKTIKVFDDYEVDAVYVDSEIDLTGVIKGIVEYRTPKN